MKSRTILRLAASALVTGALLVPAVGPAPAVGYNSYPPHVSALYASPFMSGGYAAVAVSGENLPSGMTVLATRSTRATVAEVSVDASGMAGAALVKVGSVLPRTAGRYTINFTLLGSTLVPAPATDQTYTVGRQIEIKSLTVHRRSYGLYIHGKAARRTPVRISVTFGSKVYGATVTSSTQGYFHYRFKKTRAKGTYTVTAQVAPNSKYFSDPVSFIYVRS